MDRYVVMVGNDKFYLFDKLTQQLSPPLSLRTIEDILDSEENRQRRKSRRKSRSRG